MKWFDYLLSTRAMALLLLLMASAVGVATFIENSYDTITAKVLIYNAKWFELILFLLLINFINNIKTYQCSNGKNGLFNVAYWIHHHFDWCVRN